MQKGYRQAFIPSSMPLSFKVSVGWLSNWKKRYSVCFKKSSGGEEAADHEAVEKWLKEELPELLEAFKPKEMINGDETAIFYRGLPDKGFVPGNPKASGGKTATDRVSLLVTCNMDGSELALMMLGRSKRPRGFPRDVSTLLAQCKSRVKGWMTGAIFTKFLREGDWQLRATGTVERHS